jgi:hypothetical protein
LPVECGASSFRLKNARELLQAGIASAVPWRIQHVADTVRLLACAKYTSTEAPCAPGLAQSLLDSWTSVGIFGTPSGFGFVDASAACTSGAPEVRRGAWLMDLDTVVLQPLQMQLRTSGHVYSTMHAEINPRFGVTELKLLMDPVRVPGAMEWQALPAFFPAGSKDLADLVAFIFGRITSPDRWPYRVVMEKVTRVIAANGHTCDMRDPNGFAPIKPRHKVLIFNQSKAVPTVQDVLTGRGYSDSAASAASAASAVGNSGVDGLCGVDSFGGPSSFGTSACFAVNVVAFSRKDKHGMEELPGIKQGSFYQQVLAHIGVRPHSADSFPAQFERCTLKMNVGDTIASAIRPSRRVRCKTPQSRNAATYEPMRLACKNHLDFDAFLAVAATNRGVATWPVAVSYYSIRNSMLWTMHNMRDAIPLDARQRLLGHSFALLHRLFGVARTPLDVKRSADTCLCLAASLHDIGCSSDLVVEPIRDAHSSNCDRAAFIAAELLFLRYLAKASASPGR